MFEDNPSGRENKVAQRLSNNASAVMSSKSARFWANGKHGDKIVAQQISSSPCGVFPAGFRRSFARHRVRLQPTSPTTNRRHNAENDTSPFCRTFFTLTKQRRRPWAFRSSEYSRRRRRRRRVCTTAAAGSEVIGRRSTYTSLSETRRPGRGHTRVQSLRVIMFITRLFRFRFVC